jgi:anti-sigma regulatory factor (Ser/Thr protein kinase)
MSQRRSEVQDFIIKSVSEHPQDLLRFVAKHFKVSVQAIQKHLSPLLKEGIVVKTGTTRNATYSLARRDGSLPLKTSDSWTVASGEWRYTVDDSLSEQTVWDSTLKARLEKAPENIRGIAEYGFTEMVNNVKDHSQAKNLYVSYRILDSNLEMTVQDDGIGIFRKLKKTLGLETLREAVLHLSKGKLTTDHTRHTGEGIFFSSRVFDNYSLLANGLSYTRINTPMDEDWLLGEEAVKAGTRVDMKIDLNSRRTLDEVFRRFTSPEDFSFSKTHVAVELGINEGETYVSRSQAKRIMAGLEKFRFIVLNFKRVNAVGQGFVDEVFRVFKNAHPEIQVDYINANESVEFMIRRSIQT